MRLVSRFLLAIPLLWFAFLWLYFVVDIDLTPSWLFYNAARRPEEPPAEGLLPDDIFPLLFFFISPILFFIGSIYTAYKKLWWWFGVYMLIGGLPFGIFSIAVFL
ncbi:hypothetical protein KDD30_07920 [Photobacterium sp. GJ3]|nr:hypothetical protein KDD30_07920 [Photobacterium sp. GJ3]